MFAHIESAGSDLRLRLYGALDGRGAETLRARVERAASTSQGDLLLDLIGVHFIDDDGLDEVVFLSRQLAARRRRLRLVGLSDAWRTRLRELGLSNLLAPSAALPSTLAPSPRRAAMMH